MFTTLTMSALLLAYPRPENANRPIKAPAI